jgi:carbon monoxide dehydrogenase subunit G
MVVITNTREVRAGTDTVWQTLVDWRRERDYWDNVRDIRVLKTEDTTIEREATVGPSGFAQKTKQKLVLDPEAKSIVLSLDGDRMKGERTILLVPTGTNETRIEVAWDLSLNGLPGFVENIVRNQISKATEKALKKIAETAESASTLKDATRSASR